MSLLQAFGRCPSVCPLHTHEQVLGRSLWRKARASPALCPSACVGPSESPLPAHPRHSLLPPRPSSADTAPHWSPLSVLTAPQASVTQHGLSPQSTLTLPPSYLGVSPHSSAAVGALPSPPASFPALSTKLLVTAHPQNSPPHLFAFTYAPALLFLSLG